MKAPCMKKIFYGLLCSLGFSLTTFAMEDQNNALKLLKENYIRPEFFDKPLRRTAFLKSVSTYLNYIKKNEISKNNYFESIEKNTDFLHNLKMNVLFAQSALKTQQDSHFWKMFRRGCYAVGGVCLVAKGIGILSIDNLNMQDKVPGTIVGSLFFGLGATTSLLAAQSGKEHWSQYQNTQQLRKEYDESVATPLNKLEEID